MDADARRGGVEKASECLRRLDLNTKLLQSVVSFARDGQRIVCQKPGSAVVVFCEHVREPCVRMFAHT